MKRVLSCPLVWIALSLLLVDAFFIAAEVMHRMHRFYGSFSWFGHPGWRADPDGSFAEIWGYAKAITAGILLIVLWRKLAHASVLLATAALFVVVALDDMLQIHEIGGGKLVRAFDLPEMFGLRGQDLGELIVWAALGIPLLVWILVAYIRSSPVPRRITRALFPPFLALLFFAVVVDFFLILAVNWEWGARALYVVTLVEAVGELAALTTVLLVPIYYLMLRGHRSEDDISQ